MKKLKLQTREFSSTHIRKRHNLQIKPQVYFDKETDKSPWDFLGIADAICIPTNGSSKPLEGTIGKEALKYFPTILKNLEIAIKFGANTSHIVEKYKKTGIGETKIVTIPIRPIKCIVNEHKSNILNIAKRHYAIGEDCPGYLCKPSIALFSQAILTMEYTCCDILKYKHVVIAPMECFEFDEIKLLLKQIHVYQRPEIQLCHW